MKEATTIRPDPFRLLIASLLVVGAVSGAWAQDADEIMGIAGNIKPGWIYNGPGATPPSTWWMEALEFEAGSVVGWGGQEWNIAPVGQPDGSFSWTENELLADYSANGVAKGSFGMGGVLEIYGGVYDKYTGDRLTETDNDLVLRGTVRAFLVEESSLSPDLLDLKGLVTMRPTDGFLVTNTIEGGMRAKEVFTVSMSISNAQQNGGHVSNFQDSIVFNVGTEVQMWWYPEPSTLLLLGAVGGWSLVRRTRIKGR